MSDEIKAIGSRCVYQVIAAPFPTQMPTKEEGPSAMVLIGVQHEVLRGGDSLILPEFSGTVG